MSSIIKSSAVVVNHAEHGHKLFSGVFESNSDMPVIKRRALNGQRIPFPQSAGRAPDKDSYLDELNRVKVDIAEAEAELRIMTRRVEEAKEEMVHLEKKRAILQDLSDLGVDEQALHIIHDAEQKADVIRAQARSESEAMVESLRTQGYIDGLEMGATEAREKFQMENNPQMEKIAQLMWGLSSIKEQLIRENESELVGLVTVVAEKIIGKQLHLDPTLVVDMLRDVLEQNRRESFIKITISKDLMPAEAKVSDGVKRMITDMGQQIDVFVDEEADPGTLVMETPKGFTDLTVSSQLENIHDILAEVQE